ncbi:MAG: hypothetical protein M5U19_11345 [Microthrixaceae bacterium]|nr:hypothetical protein [Microthrixaceae bacterium]
MAILEIAVDEPATHVEAGAALLDTRLTDGMRLRAHLPGRTTRR